jgi:hypothetical protein
MSAALPPPGASAGRWLGCSLGERTVSWTDRDPILFALAIGASPDQLDLVFEEQLRVIPTFAITLTQWAPDVLGTAGAFDVSTAVHGAQSLRVWKPLPREGELTMTARVTGVWDKGTAAVYDVAVESDCFVATWSLFAPNSHRSGRGSRDRPASTDPARPGDAVRLGALAGPAVRVPSG